MFEPSTHANGGHHSGAIHIPNGEAATMVRPAIPANGAEPPVRAGEGETKRAPVDRVRVADIKKGELDHCGEMIEHVFHHRRDFAIYRSGDKVAVYYSDDENTEKRQTAAVAELVFLRGRLQFLMSGMKGPNPYHGQIAEALRLCLDSRETEAKAMMQMLIDTIVEHRMQKGRDFYLMSTGTMVGIVIALLCGAAAGMWYLWGLTPDAVASGLRCLMLATGSGALGASMSTALALQARNGAAAAKTHVDPRWNSVDGVARILIGVTSAAALCLFLNLDFLGAIKIGDLPLKAVIDWQSALLVGFAAGFLERLVPDLLEKKFATIAK